VIRRCAFIAFVVLALSGPAEARELPRKIAVAIGAAADLPVCHEYLVEQYAGSSCVGAVVFDAEAMWTPGNAFLLRPALSVGVGYDSDAAVAHYYDVEGAQPIEDVLFSAVLGVGAARRTQAVEVQFSVGPRLDVAALSARHELVARGYEEDPYGEVWFGGEIEFAVHIDLGETLTLGPRLTFAAGNEVSLMFTDACEAGEAWCEDATSIHQDIEFEIRPALALAVPSAGPAAFVLEVGPEIQVATYTPSMHASLLDRNYERPRTAVDIFPWLWVGVQLRK
jgi:hypothetical protein